MAGLTPPGWRHAAAAPAVTISAVGAMVPEALDAAERLDSMGFAADVVCVTSPGLLFRAAQARRGLAEAEGWILERGSSRGSGPRRW